MRIFEYFTNDETIIENDEQKCLYFNEDLLDSYQIMQLNNLNLNWYYIIDGDYSNLITGDEVDIEEASYILSA